MQTQNQFDVQQFWEFANKKLKSQQTSKLNPFMRFFMHEIPPDHEGGEPLFKPRFGRWALAATAVLTGGYLLVRPQAMPQQRPAVAMDPVATTTGTANVAPIVPTVAQDPRTIQVPRQLPPAVPLATVPPAPMMTRVLPPTQIVAPPPRMLPASVVATGSKEESLRQLLASRHQDKPLYVAQNRGVAGQAEGAQLGGNKATSLSVGVVQNQISTRRHVSAGTTIRARLANGVSGPLGSLPVIAEVSEPLAQGDEVIVPTGSRLIGVTGQAGAGRVEMTFTVLVTPDGVERKLDGAIALQAGSVGVMAEIQDRRTPDGSGVFAGNLLTEVGSQLQQPSFAQTVGSVGSSYSSVTNAPVDQRLAGGLAKAMGNTLQQGVQAQRQAMAGQPVTVKILPAEITVLLLKGADI